MTTGGRAMKILKIENGNGLFLDSKKNEWIPIDQIDKNNLMILLDLFLQEEVEMDNLEDHALSNQAQQIIYKSIFDKLDSLIENKDKFKDESDRTYLSAIQKYSES